MNTSKLPSVIASGAAFPNLSTSRVMTKYHISLISLPRLLAQSLVQESRELSTLAEQSETRSGDQLGIPT